MNHARINKALTDLGLSQTDANVYIYLATNGPQKAEKIVETLKLKEQLLYQSIAKLKDKGIVSSAFEQSALFSALPFDKALELLLKAHLKEAQTLEQDKNEILSKWKAITEHS